MARASIQLMNLDKETYKNQTSNVCSHINVGTGQDLSIKELAELISDVIGFTGKIIFDRSKPDGNPRKLLNSERISNLGFEPEVNLKEGLKKTYEDYLKS